MADKPLIFGGPMVRALLEGRKSQTRRILSRHNVTVLGERWGRSSPWSGLRFEEAWVRENSPISGARYPHLAVPFCHPDDEPTPTEDCGIYRVRPEIEPGDRLWVRETFALIWPDEFPPERPEDNTVEYRADTDGRCLPGRWPDDERDNPERPKWRSPIHMPRWASRLTLLITDVRIQRLQDISEEDARAEGISPLPSGRFYCGEDDEGEVTAKSPVTAFGWLWNSIHGPDAWMLNPWVIALTFRVLPHNIDALTEDPGHVA